MNDTFNIDSEEKQVGTDELICLQSSSDNLELMQVEVKQI